VERVRWTVLSRTKDDDGETTTWLVEVGKPQEQTNARDEQGQGDDEARTDEGRE
jgi:hypothetical protein